MWLEVKTTKTLAMAEMWKEAFEGEGVPARIMPKTGLPIGQEFAEYSVLVPQDKEHVIKDILRKL